MVKSNNATVNKSIDEMLKSIDELKSTFTKCGVNVKFTDNTNYCASGVGKRITFSVNLKKTKYNVFCTDEICDTIENAKIDDLVIERGTNNATYIKNAIYTKSTNTLEKVLKTVAKNYNELQLVK